MITDTIPAKNPHGPGACRHEVTLSAAAFLGGSTGNGPDGVASLRKHPRAIPQHACKWSAANDSTAQPSAASTCVVVGFRTTGSRMRTSSPAAAPFHQHLAPPLHDPCSRARCTCACFALTEGRCGWRRRLPELPSRTSWSERRLRAPSHASS